MDHRHNDTAGDRHTFIGDSNSLYELLFRNSRDIILFIRMEDGRILEANPAAVQCYGYTREELLSMKIRDLRDGHTNSKTNGQMIEADKQGILFETVHRCKSGRSFPVEVSSQEFPSGGKRILLSIIRDISTRRRTKAALKESEARLRAVLEALPVTVIIADADGRLVEANPAAEQLWDGKPPLSSHPSEYARDYPAWWPDTGKRLEPHEWGLARALLKGERCIAEELGIETLSGRCKTILNYAIPILDSAGRVTGGVAVNIDITERKKTELALRRSEALYRAIARHFPDGAIYVFDHNMRFLVAEGEAMRRLGLDREKVEGRTAGELMDAGLAAFHQDTFRRVLGGESFQIETPHNGRVFLSHCVPIRDEEGKIHAGMVVSLDITERKQNLQNLTELNENLEALAAERAAVAENRARQLQGLAVQLIEAEEKERRRIADLLHDDLQQILASARMHLSAALEKNPDESLIQRAGRLIDESIKKSRSLSHELSPQVLHHADLHTAMEWLAQQMQSQHGLRVEVVTQRWNGMNGGILKIFLFRSVQELLFNVVKHAGTNDATVCLDNDGKRLTVSVSDKGCGFDRERMDQLNGTRSGFGLLSIRERAKSVGGAFDIISSPGAGSCFTISVPFRISKPYLGAVSFSDAAGEPAHTGETGRDIRVVFVDDHEVIRKALINLVSGTTGIRVAGEASNGAEAVDLVRRTRPDVVVMDVSMPVMDGLQATRLLKDEQPGLRIIGLSMIEDEYIARDMRRAGAETYLTKAVSSTDLLKAIYGLADDV